MLEISNNIVQNQLLLAKQQKREESQQQLPLSTALSHSDQYLSPTQNAKKMHDISYRIIEKDEGKEEEGMLIMKRVESPIKIMSLKNP